MDQNVVLGSIYAVVSIITYGSTYVPCRWFEAGDGLFFQWLMCIGQFLVGLVVYVMVGCPTFYPICMTGGMLFALGNALTIFIMDGLGMAVGSLLWNTVTCIVGWAVSRFGLFGSPMLEPKHNILNILGVVIVCVGGCIFAPIKHYPMKLRPAPGQFEVEKEMRSESKDDGPHRVSPIRRIISILICCLVGFFYGNMLTGINYIVATEPAASPILHAHFFAFSVGALFISTLVFIVYSLAKRNRPFVNPELAVPSLSAGVIYGVATCSFFAANHYLGQVIAYPIIAKSPGIVVSLWAVLLFREIRGRWNIAALVAGIAVTILGVTLISLSKVEF